MHEIKIDTRDREREYLRAQTIRRIEGIERQRRDAEFNADKAVVRSCTSWLKYLQRIQMLLMGRSHKEHTSKTVYIAGKITGDRNYKQKFAKAEERLLERGWRVLSPAKLPDDLPYEKYGPICCAMIDGSDAVYFLRDWTQSPGAVKEYIYAGKRDVEILFERKE